VKLTGDIYDYHQQGQNTYQFEIMYIFKENPDKTLTVIKNIRGSLLSQRQTGKGDTLCGGQACSSTCLPASQ
jgi:hypothetical protein